MNCSGPPAAPGSVPVLLSSEFPAVDAVCPRLHVAAVYAIFGVVPLVSPAAAAPSPVPALQVTVRSHSPSSLATSGAARGQATTKPTLVVKPETSMNSHNGPVRDDLLHLYAYIYVQAYTRIRVVCARKCIFFIPYDGTEVSEARLRVNRPESLPK